MIILLTGASGFIGRHLADALLAHGHDVIVASRKPGHAARPGLREVAADFSRDIEPAAWLSRLAGVDVVINAVGILRESPGQRFELLHERAPRALFAACAEAGRQAGDTTIGTGRGPACQQPLPSEQEGGRRLPARVADCQR